MPNTEYRVHYIPRTREEADRENEKKNRSYLNYAHRCLLISLHGNLGFGTERLRTMSYNSYDVGEAAIEENTIPPLLTSVEDLLAGAEPEFGEPDFLETLGGTYWDLRKELISCGWEPEASLWPWKDPFTDADFPETWRKISVSQRKKREAFLRYANDMSKVCLTLMCMCAVELHRTNRFGAERLDRAMRPVGERWKQFMRVYLTMDEEAVIREQKKVRDEYNAMGAFRTEYGV